ncbi:hypothetical protein [Uliginosibacterium gangwonense]|uniref:hypothetical protein n=1 Tax=Uliginosibacterium gangwonense TaxID=392736 RepID=UPI00037CC9EE|nr:hypothetical protein [Uliginosibacterium gangwonense]
METIKLMAPDGVTAASFGGQEYLVDAEGVVTVPVEAALTLYGFGYGNAPEDKPVRSRSRKTASTDSD